MGAWAEPRTITGHGPQPVDQAPERAPSRLLSVIRSERRMGGWHSRHFSTSAGSPAATRC
jgi:hypothetical protein